MTVQKVNGGVRFGPVPRSDIPQTVQKRKLNGWQLLTDAPNLKTTECWRVRIGSLQGKSSKSRRLRCLAWQRRNSPTLQSVCVHFENLKPAIRLCARPVIIPMGFIGHQDRLHELAMQPQLMHSIMRLRAPHCLDLSAVQVALSRRLCARRTLALLQSWGDRTAFPEVVLLCARSGRPKQ